MAKTGSWLGHKVALKTSRPQLSPLSPNLEEKVQPISSDGQHYLNEVM